MADDLTPSATPGKGDDKRLLEKKLQQEPQQRSIINPRAESKQRT